MSLYNSTILVKALNRVILSQKEKKEKKVIQALKYIISEEISKKIPTVVIPVGSYLFHGTLESFSDDLRHGGYDKLIWFADSPKIAQIYLPKSGMTTYVSAEDLIKPSKDKVTQSIQKMIGIEYDMSEIEWDGNRLKSWGAPIGWDTFPKESDIKKSFEKLGYKDNRGTYKIRIGNGKVLKPNEAQKGRLFIAKVKEPLTIWPKSKGEGDLMDLQYHDLEGFEAARAMGLDGVLIDDFAQSEEWGNFGHLSVGLFNTSKLEVRSIPAEYREWDYKPKGTPEYPNPPEIFLHKLNASYATAMKVELLTLLGGSVITDEMKTHFKKRTDMHISLVRKYAQKIMDLNLPEVDNKEIQKESDIHDEGKWKDPEYGPYLHITWHYREKDQGRKYVVPKNIKDEMDKATFHHIKNHRHHPEYWDDEVTLDSLNTDDRDQPTGGKLVDGTIMPLSHIASMMADWLGMSEEKNTSVRDWAENNVNIRWKFTKEQVDLITKIIDKIEVKK